VAISTQWEPRHGEFKNLNILNAALTNHANAAQPQAPAIHLHRKGQRHSEVVQTAQTALNKWQQE
jgi:hypothetical protein